MTFRSRETQDAYDRARSERGTEAECALCGGPAVNQFTHWKIMRNIFPYDKIASRHQMIVPLRHVRETELTLEERVELDQIKEEYVHTNYDYILEATHKVKSIPEHFHLHLIDILQGI